ARACARSWRSRDPPSWDEIQARHRGALRAAAAREQQAQQRHPRAGAVALMLDRLGPGGEHAVLDRREHRATHGLGGARRRGWPRRLPRPASFASWAYAIAGTPAAAAATRAWKRSATTRRAPAKKSRASSRVAGGGTISAAAGSCAANARASARSSTPAPSSL